MRDVQLFHLALGLLATPGRSRIGHRCGVFRVWTCTLISSAGRRLRALSVVRPDVSHMTLSRRRGCT
jgi:hypothetical protein